MLRRLATAISRTRVSAERARAGQSMVLSGWPGGRWLEITVKDWPNPRWVTGIPARVGAEVTLDRPGDHRAEDIGSGAGQYLPATTTEHERVAALEPNHMAAVAGVGEDGLEDRFLAELVGAGRLAGIDEQDARVQLGGEFRVGEAVGHDDGGRMQGLPAA
jgi:hypothetical protein